MRITLDLDDDMLQRGHALTGESDPSALLTTALKALIERESARELARLGGVAPDMKGLVRRRGQQS